MMKVKILPTGHSQSITTLSVQARQIDIDVAQLPVEVEFVEEVVIVEQPVEPIVTEPPTNTASVVITAIAKLTKQTGTHRMSTSNGFAGSGTVEDLAENLRNFGIEVSFENDVMIFTNTTSQNIEITMQAQGRSGKPYVPIEQENTSIQLDSKNASFQLSVNNKIPSVARLSHSNRLYNLNVSNGYSSRPRFVIYDDTFVKAGIHAYMDNGQFVLSNRTPEEITVEFSTYDKDFVPIEQANKTIQLSGKTVRLTLGAYKDVDFFNQQATVLPMLNSTIIPDNEYVMSYRVNGTEIKQITVNRSETNAQTSLANVMSYERLISGSLSTEGSHSFSDDEATIRPFLASYSLPIQGASSNHSKFIRHAHFYIEFLLTDNAEHDLVKETFGQNTTLHSYAIVDWLDYQSESANTQPIVS